MSVKWVDYDCKFVNPVISEEDAIHKIEYAYRVCYNSIDKMKIESYEDSIKFVKDKIKLGHGSPLEHVNITVDMIIDRGILAEWTRHRISSFSVESTRYCKYSGDIECILPTQLRNASEEDKRVFENGIINACDNYQLLLSKGVSPQNARGVLPQSLKVHMVVTHNIREWFHVFDLRYFGKAGNPHPDFKYCMNKVYRMFNSKYPNIFSEEPIQI